MTSWIDRDTALRKLGIKAQTLYAYASRGRIRMRPDPADSRRSLYSADDVAEVSARKARGRKPATIAASSLDWGEPAIATRLSSVHRGRLSYRGRDALELAHRSTLEEAAALLWDLRRPPVFSDDAIFPSEASEASAAGYAGAAVEAGRAGRDAFGVLAAEASRARPILGRGGDRLAGEAAAMVGRLASACGAVDGSGPVHERLATGWKRDARTADRLRQALVAMADHDLNASTFAARVAASTGASLPACLLAGLCALSGPRHGGAGEALRSLAADARRQGVGKAVRQWLARDRMLPGFGHPLYPDGDPRAALMLADLDVPADLSALAAGVFDLTGRLPNCDYALAVLVEALGLPEDGPFRLFLIARTVGWCAHVMEQNQTGTLIRPRGRYEGASPD